MPPKGKIQPPKEESEAVKRRKQYAHVEGFLPKRDKNSELTYDKHGYALGTFDKKTYKSFKWALVLIKGYYAVVHDEHGRPRYSKKPTPLGGGVIILNEETEKEGFVKDLRENAVSCAQFRQVDMNDEEQVAFLERYLFGRELKKKPKADKVVDKTPQEPRPVTPVFNGVLGCTQNGTFDKPCLLLLTVASMEDVSQPSIFQAARSSA